MKKLLLILAIAGFAVACNSKKKEKTEEKKADTTVNVSHDTTVVTTDTTHM